MSTYPTDDQLRASRRMRLSHLGICAALSSGRMVALPSLATGRIEVATLIGPRGRHLNLMVDRDGCVSFDLVITVLELIEQDDAARAAQANATLAKILYARAARKPE